MAKRTDKTPDAIADAEAKIAELHKQIADHKATASAKEEAGHLLNELGSLEEGTTMSIRFQNPRTGKNRDFILSHDAADTIADFVTKQQAKLDKPQEDTDV